jgi:hypothetical protein
VEDQVPGSYEDIGKIDPGTAVTIYERLRHDDRINAEPLFWLQYAIAMAEDRKLPAAQEFIATAYARAADRPGFQTYQIDTQALRILLLMESEAGSGGPVARLPEILEKIELLNSMLSEESHRGYAIRILEGMRWTPSVGQESGRLKRESRRVPTSLPIRGDIRPLV